MNIFDHIPQISEHALFKGIDTTIVSKYLHGDSISLHTYSPSDVIIAPESEDTPICVIVKGTVEILCPTASHKVLLKTSSAGTIFGIANLYAAEAKFPSTVCAKSETSVLTISKNAFVKMLENEPDIMRNFLVFLSRKVIYLNKKIASYTAGSAERKVAYFLCENEIDGTVSTSMSFSDIAIMLDMGRASLYRAFDKLEEEKLISRDGRQIHILNKEKLKMFI